MSDDLQDTDLPRWKRAVLSMAAPAERGFDAIKRRLASRFDRDDPVHIMVYRGFGTARKIAVTGRVLQDEPVGAAQ